MSLAWLRPVARRAARSRLGQKFVSLALSEGTASLDLSMFHVGRHFNEGASFEAAAGNRPERITGFEDLMWLFSLIPVNRGVLRLDLDEAAYLYQVAQSLPKRSRCVEVGRFKGGSTFLMGAALPEEAKVISIDNHTKMDLPANGPIYDRALQKELARYGLEERVELLVMDSLEAPAEPESLEMAFLDGDHTFEGVSRDFHHWKGALKRGGHLMLHDAAVGRPYATGLPGCMRLVRGIEEREPEFTKVGQVGSLVHFVRSSALPPSARTDGEDGS